MATKNITLAIEEDLLKEGRKYARKHGTSLNELIRRLLSRTVAPKKADWINELFALMDQMPPPPADYKWNRDDAYSERLEWPRRS